jgi:hypothetical protein
VTPGAQQVEDREPGLVRDDGFAVVRHERAGSAATAATTKGKRLPKSWPLRVKSCTPAVSRRARMRKPSCLISWSQSGPVSGCLAGDGRHGSMKPIAPFRGAAPRSRAFLNPVLGLVDGGLDFSLLARAL